MAEGLYRGSVPGSLLDSLETAEALLLTGPLPTPSGAAWLDSGEPIPVDDDSSAGSSNLNPHPGPADVVGAGPPGHGRPPRGHSFVSGRSVVTSLDNRFRRRTRKARKAMPQQMRTATVRPIVMPTFCLVEKPGWSSPWCPAFGTDEANAGGPVMEERLDVDVEAVTDDRLEAAAVIEALLDAELMVPDAEAEAVCRNEASETKGVWPSLKLMVPRSAVGRVARPDRVGL